MIINVEVHGHRWKELAEPFEAVAKRLEARLAPTNSTLNIDVYFQHVDGARGTLAFAYPTAVWGESGLAASGVAVFDMQDFYNLRNTGGLATVIEHEFLHIVGIGTGAAWGECIEDGFKFVGVNAVAAYRELKSDATFIPVEQSGGRGTAGGHWDEEALGNEIATGFLGSGPQPFTAITLGALDDLGWDVNYRLVDPISDVGAEPIRSAGYRGCGSCNRPAPKALVLNRR